ncbi:MAG TPA: peptidylprolyl isomerase [Terriglobia bacterium]|nr:peptidylprolyl isomerase [Terriglobia bacterium]
MSLFSRKKQPEQAAETTPDEPQPADSPIELNQPAGLYAVFETTMGRMVCKLFPEKFPVTVQNFIELAEGKKKWHNAAEREWEERRYYDGLGFHRVIPDFMIQGGDYMGTGAGSVGYKFQDEFSPEMVFDKPGKLAMANAGPNTNGAQFFVTVAPTPWLNQKHTIFGEIVEGQEIAKAISETPRDVRDRPLKPVIMRRVVIVETRKPAQ